LSGGDRLRRDDERRTEVRQGPRFWRHQAAAGLLEVRGKEIDHRREVERGPIAVAPLENGRA
jgi:hypothetical protein